MPEGAATPGTVRDVTVIRSTKRRKTAQARLVDGTLEVRIPARSSKAEEARLVEQFRRRFDRAALAEARDLPARARRLARRFDVPEPTEIRWVANQAHRWGSCTPDTGVIRLSDRLAGFPPWVIDHVIVHELAHLVERGHGPAFHALVSRNPLAERAEGYLIARSGGEAPHTDPFADTDDTADETADDEPEPAPIALGPGDPLPPAGTADQLSLDLP